MRFNALVAIFAMVSLSASYAQAQEETATPTQGVVVINSNSQAATAQPTTVVEAAPVQESKADLMRKARQSEEVKTEQKIVEKLEESRLKEEQQRAERLFGNKLDTPAETQHVEQQQVVAPVVVEAPKEEKKEEKPQVTIEKVEIIQPAPIKEEKLEAPLDAKLAMKEDVKKDEEQATDRFFVGAILAAPNYNTSNVKTNYGLGASVGINLATNWSIEASFLYSNHSVDTYWTPGLFKDLDQYDVSASAKYYILSGKLKPYLGGSVTYIKRVYNDRIYNWNGGSMAAGWGSQETDAVDAGLLGGVDFEISKNILIGAGLEYNFNVMNKNDFRTMYSQYGLPDTRPLEEIDYYTVKVGAKFLF
jgi:opacity protein-like surface antigen